MKRFCILLLICSFSVAARPQELRLSTALPPDTAGLLIDYRYDHYQVQRELRLLVDVPDEWRTELHSDEIQSDAWRRDHGRQYTWRIGVDATTFLRDAAFSLPYTRGYTATGFFVKPYAKHLIGQDAQMTFGLLLSGAAGYDGLRAWQPLVRLEYEPFTNFRLVMGSLYGTLSHGLYEPMLDRERYIYDHQEEGVQILADYSIGSLLGWSMDIWLHWEDLLEPWQPKQERFSLGTSQLITFGDPLCHGRMTVSLPLSFLGSHRGGQFSTLDTCIQSLFTESAGLRVNLATGMVSAVALDVPFFFFQDVSPTKCLPYSNGWAVWPQLSFDWQFAHDVPRPPDEPQPFWRGSWRLLVQAGYWHGHQYIAPRGSYLFQSVSWHRPDFAEPERRMVTAKLAFENRYNSRFSLGLDTEYYYDLREQAMDFAFGLYLRYHLPSRSLF